PRRPLPEDPLAPRQQPPQVALVVEAERGGRVGRVSDGHLFANPPLSGLVQIAQQQLQPPFGRTLFRRKARARSGSGEFRCAEWRVWRAEQGG
ncbi:MAG: hypothetical protein R6X34_02625, partial [Chloroflexota bacterium]